MKGILNLIFLLSPLICLGQGRVCVYNNYEVLGNDTINRMIDGIRQGDWIYYQEGVESITCFTPISCYHEKWFPYIISKGKYVDGIKIGEWNAFYKTGELRQKDFYSTNGQRNSASIKYFPNGKVKSKQDWEQDSLIQESVFWETGNKRYNAIFLENQLKAFTIFYKSGNPKYTGKLQLRWELEELIGFEENGKVKKIQTSNSVGALMIAEGLLEYL